MRKFFTVKQFILSLVLLLGALCFYNNKTVYAYPAYTFNGLTLNGGVGNYGYNNRYYFITPNAAAYLTHIDNAFYDWVHTTERTGVSTPISISRTYNQINSVFDFHSDNVGSAYARTAHMYLSTEINLDVNPISTWTNWGWTKIIFDNYNFPKLSNFDKTGTTAHEIGHAMGLAHRENSTTSIMCSLVNGRNVNKCNYQDLNTINELY